MRLLNYRTGRLCLIGLKIETMLELISLLIILEPSFVGKCSDCLFNYCSVETTN